MRPMTDDARWAALTARDKGCDGLFVVAVQTTGVYCRPSCSARQPRRENVTFYDNAQAASAAGFRPCKRCAPDSVAHDAEMVARVCRYIESHLDERLTLDTLGNHVGLSPQHMQRIFKRAMGISPREYADAQRMEAVKARLSEGASVTGALYEAGYSSSSRLYERAAGHLGMTPATYRQGGAGQTIRYAAAQCALGWVLIGATAKGICAVRLGDTPEFLVSDLERSYPAATIESDTEGLGEWLAALLRHLEGQQPHLDLPLDIRATAFQQRVWAALRAIPYGETRSYTQVAQAIGQPTAARAVAQACANNPVAVVIPCHRVVREDGSLSGYRWGVERKRALLDHERMAFISSE
ncbi:MAG: bifunctional DNA-binding transcriptional regulator/O6-methylguanine-DNA methyltransferase Ada [Anaerolineae bacterium]|nr:bifunctional DNA-binding transcriptional regulator/O6-methylguanine-DNA methyltransferase Ada [Anaerolineae bacterium]